MGYYLYTNFLARWQFHPRWFQLQNSLIMTFNKPYRISVGADYTSSKLNADYKPGKSSVQAGFIILFRSWNRVIVSFPNSSAVFYIHRKYRFHAFQKRYVKRYEILEAGMILIFQVFYTLDSKKSLWYTTIQHNMNMPDTA